MAGVSELEAYFTRTVRQTRHTHTQRPDYCNPRSRMPRGLINLSPNLCMDTSKRKINYKDIIFTFLCNVILLSDIAMNIGRT